VNEKEYDKKEAPKTIESDLEIGKENDSSPSIVSNPIVTYKPRVLYPQALDAPIPSKMDK